MGHSGGKVMSKILSIQHSSLHSGIHYSEKGTSMQIDDNIETCYIMVNFISSMDQLILYLKIFYLKPFSRMIILRSLFSSWAASCRSNKSFIKRNTIYEALLKGQLSIYEREEISKLIAKHISKKASLKSNYNLISKKTSDQRLGINPNSDVLSRYGWQDVSCELTKNLANEVQAYVGSIEEQIKMEVSLNTKKRAYDLDQRELIKLPSVADLLKNQELHHFIEMQIGLPVKIKFFQAFLSFPIDGAQGSQLWHRDRDDFKELKMFIYCSDVDYETGPHAFLPCSHRIDFNKQMASNSSEIDKSLISDKRRQRYEDTTLKRIYPSVDYHVFTGNAGTSFIENTHGLHRGYPPSNKTRLMFAICWCIGMEYFNNSPDYVLKSQEALNSLKN